MLFRPLLPCFPPQNTYQPAEANSVHPGLRVSCSPMISQPSTLHFCKKNSAYSESRRDKKRIFPGRYVELPGVGLCSSRTHYPSLTPPFAYLLLRQSVRRLFSLWYDRLGRVSPTVSWALPGKSGHTLCRPQ